MALWLERQIKVYVLIVSVCLGAWTSAATSPNSTLAEFERWIARHGRRYEDGLEKAKRYGIFLENFRFVEEFNDKAANRSYKVGLNQFSDLTTEEFIARYTGFRPMAKSSNSSATTTFKYQNVNQVPDSVNWIDRGVVNGVRTQGGCGACWAFSAVAAVESVTAIKTGALLDLSEQELIDCANLGRTHGCTGGFMTDAFQYIIENQGISFEQNYPYRANAQPCNTAVTVHAVRLSGYEKIPVSEDALLNAVAMQPVSIGIDASSNGFKHYAGGLFKGPCGTNLIHAVTVVGYGTTPDGVAYWLLRNSWGPGWGEHGYMRIQRNSGSPGGLCGLVMEASYPDAF